MPGARPVVPFALGGSPGVDRSPPGTVHDPVLGVSEPAGRSGAARSLPFVLPGGVAVARSRVPAAPVQGVVPGMSHRTVPGAAVTGQIPRSDLGRPCHDRSPVAVPVGVSGTDMVVVIVVVTEVVVPDEGPGTATVVVAIPGAVVNRPVPVIQGGPADIGRSPGPGDPGAAEHPSRDPAPAVAGQPVPATVVVRSPAPVLIGDPEISAGSVGPVSGEVGPPAGLDLGGVPHPAVVVGVGPAAAARQFPVVRLNFVGKGFVNDLVVVVLIVTGAGAGPKRLIPGACPAIEAIRRHRAVGGRFGRVGSGVGHRLHAAADQYRAAVSGQFGYAPP